MRLALVWEGRIRDARLQALEQEYLARLQKFVSVEVIVVRDSGCRSAFTARVKSGDPLESRIPPGSTVIALDEGGKELTSRGFAGLLERLQVSGTRAVSFVMGGPRGLGSSIVERADHVLSLSRMTWTHEMSRVLLLEQLYRAFTLMRGYPYHK